jgi:uncharacterized protein (DUF427 family)
MSETLSRPLVPSAMERARLKDGVHIERSPRRVRTYFGGKLIADSSLSSTKLSADEPT